MKALGPFELTDPIGRGGMGEVWGARHRVDRRPVAIKVITDTRALQDRFQAAFRNEARAMAGMEHVGIARILDFGVVEAPPTDSMRQGSPFLVMERLGRSLDVERAATDWPTLRQILLDLLDALAHAHARGLVHRDLKPDNVLWSNDGRTLKLTDFGVAHAMDGGTPRDGARRETSRTWETSGAAESGMVGTPNYMAPEQVKGQVWAHGPWTDLYALGCLAFALAVGRTPFEVRDKPLATMMAHLTEPVPPLIARIALPDGFEGWVGRLLAKTPEARFRKAADAAWALARLADVQASVDTLPPVFGPTGAAGGAAGVAGHTVDGIDLGSLGSLSGISGISDDFAGLMPAFDPAAEGERTVFDSAPPAFADAALLETGPLPVTAPRRIPPMSDDWRGADGPAPLGQQMQGVGLGLFGLRRVPFVGRETERDLLWSLLGVVADSGMAHAAVLHGPSGFGKTRLAEWLLERADELGAASGLRAMHGAVDGPGHGLSGMLERALRCVEVPPAELPMHIGRVLATLEVRDTEEVDALVGIVDPGREAQQRVDGGGRTAGLRAVRPEEQFAIVRRHLERLAAERPLVVLLDDAHYSRRALDFCAHVLDAQRHTPCPILLVLTVRDEDLAARPDAVERLDGLVARDAMRVEVGPLDAHDRPAMLGALLGLDGELIRRVDARTGGNALFAVQLVGDWVQRGLLEPGTGGFRLASGALTALPDDIAAVWRARVEQILDGRPGEADARALELAATLGLQIGGREWQAVCAAAGLAPDPTLVEALLDAALARCGREGPAVRWSFAHGMLREAVLQRARDAGRLRLWHQICARTLAREPGRRTAERVARHLRAAGRLDEAATSFLDATRVRLDEGDYASAAEQLAGWRATVAVVADPDPRWGQGWLLESRLTRLRGRADDAEVIAEKALAAAERFGWSSERAGAMLELGIIARTSGRVADSERLLRAAGQAVGDDVALRAACAEELGVSLLRQGKRERGVAALEAAREAYRAVGDPLGLGRSLFNLARARLQAGAADEAQRYVQAAREAFESGGARGAMASCRLLDGELARQQGDLEAAAEHYRAALKLWESLGAANAPYARLNLGFTLVAADRIDEAWQPLESALRAFARSGIKVAEAAARAGLLPIAAAHGDWMAFDEQLDALEMLLAQSDLSDTDAARMCEAGVRRALAADDRGRAGRAAALAVDLWGRLGQAEKAAEVQRLVE